jgi:hypothetical protein
MVCDTIAFNDTKTLIIKDNHSQNLHVVIAFNPRIKVGWQYPNFGTLTSLWKMLEKCVAEILIIIWENRVCCIMATS